MNKEELLEEVREVKAVRGRNSMGCSESFYNAFYSMRECFGLEALEKNG